MNKTTDSYKHLQAVIKHETYYSKRPVVFTIA